MEGLQARAGELAACSWSVHAYPVQCNKCTQAFPAALNVWQRVTWPQAHLPTPPARPSWLCPRGTPWRPAEDAVGGLGCTGEFVLPMVRGLARHESRVTPCAVAASKVHSAVLSWEAR